MSQYDADRLDDIIEAVQAIREHLARGPLTEGLVFDAVRIRLVEIGEAVKSLPPALLDLESEVDWRAIARFRDQLTHHYWDTAQGVVQRVVDHQLDALAEAARRLRQREDLSDATP